MTVNLHPKPRSGTPCNGCGLCCALELCHVGELAFPGASAPCPALKIRGDGKSTYCQLVAVEAAAGMTPMIRDGLGIGRGCSMPDGPTFPVSTENANPQSSLIAEPRSVLASVASIAAAGS